MRNMDYIEISQSIGRVIRLGGAEKTFGLVCVLFMIKWVSALLVFRQWLTLYLSRVNLLSLLFVVNHENYY